MSQVSSVRRYEVKAKVERGGQTATITTDLRIEAAGPITLTPLEADAGKSGYLYVPPTSHLTVLGDTVTIEGQLKLPGRLVKIMARCIEARRRAGSSENAAIIVDGAELDPEIKEPKQLGKGVTPAGLPPGTKRSKGKKGDDATNNRILPSVEPPSHTLGKPGWSAVDHPLEMNGENGKNGAKGNPGGGILLLCKKLTLDSSFKPMLGLSARGGAGGNGQKGQDGADGGDGGEPFDGRDGVGFASLGFQMSVPGGPGGTGGTGGTGGRAGAGGNGGFILVFTDAQRIIPAHAQNLIGRVWGIAYTDAQTWLDAIVKAGARGQPGEGGKRGEGGIGGRAAGGIKSRFVPEQPKLPDGHEGKTGDRGGAPEHDGTDGTIEIKSGEALSPALLGAMSVRQLAMMADRVRAVYLGLEPEAAAAQRAAVLEQLDLLK